jgi:hypothetical protein
MQVVSNTAFRLQALKKADKLQYQCEHLKKALREQDATDGHPAA